MPLIGLAITTLYGPKIEHETYANLEAIDKLKTEQIENWLSERQVDGKILAASDGFVLISVQNFPGSCSSFRRVTN